MKKLVLAVALSTIGLSAQAQVQTLASGQVKFSGLITQTGCQLFVNQGGNSTELQGATPSATVNMPTAGATVVKPAGDLDGSAGAAVPGFTQFSLAVQCPESGLKGLSSALGTAIGAGNGANATAVLTALNNADTDLKFGVATNGYTAAGALISDPGSNATVGVQLAYDPNGAGSNLKFLELKNDFSLATDATVALQWNAIPNATEYAYGATVPLAVAYAKLDPNAVVPGAVTATLPFSFTYQ